MAKRRQSTHVQQPRASRSYWRFGVALGLSLVIAAGWAWYRLIEPRWLYQEARQASVQNPRRAAELLEIAVNQSNGDFPEAQLLWSRTLLHLGQRVEALGCFSMIKQPDQLVAEDVLKLAHEARQSGEFLLTSLALEAIPHHSDHSPEARQLLLQLRLDEQRYLDVLTLGRSLTTDQPDLPLPYFLMAQAHEQLGDPQAALTCYQTALLYAGQLPPEVVPITFRRSVRIALQMGQFDEARQWADELGKYAPPTVEDRLAQAELLRLSGETEAAWRLVNDLAKQAPANVAVLELRGTLAMEQREDAAAEHDFREALQAQPWNKGVHYKLAQVLQRAGRKSEAESHFQENRRLTEISVRILALQKQQSTDPAQERERQRELAELSAELGHVRRAEPSRNQRP